MIAPEENKVVGRQSRIIRGLVIPATWDKDGRILAVAVAGFDDTEYAVEQDAMGLEMLSMLRREVEIKALVNFDEAGLPKLTVSECQLLPRSKRRKTGGRVKIGTETNG